MQFLPSGATTPNAAIHFALLKYLHDSKMVHQVSNHAFADVANLTNPEVNKIKKIIRNAHMYLKGQASNEKRSQQRLSHLP